MAPAPRCHGGQVAWQAAAWPCRTHRRTVRQLASRAAPLTRSDQQARPGAEVLCQLLTERIRSGELPVGRTLPSEKTLQQDYGLSRGSVRKAVQVLRERGLVDTVPQRGTFVVQRPAS
ncbi:MAG TPA: winged helix-turn-helix domain-containing protein [Streptosporangiaceae bacterium]|nr:winged helix-turn-helix domain-containing protein [Streptosporangiaceae bacterium]